MPLAIYILALSVFALGTSEFVISGLLPVLAGDLHVSIPHAGLLISGFAIGMMLGAPVLALLTLRLPRKVTLLGALAVFILGNAMAALAPNYPLLFGARILTALATAAFWAVGAVTVVKLAPAGRQAKALAVMVGGLTVSNIVGVPAGTFLGQHLGWRAAFWAVAGIAALGLVGIAAVVPGQRGTGGSEQPRLATELRTFRNTRLWVALGTTALTQAGIISAFGYLSTILTRVTGLAENWVPPILLLFGMGSLLGITLAGRVADARPLPSLYVAIGTAVVVMAVLAVTAGSAVAAVLLAFLLGLFGFATAPGLNGRVFALAGSAPTLASSVNVSAFNLGNTIGPWLGGVAIGAGFGYAAPAWVGALIGVGALGLAVLSGALDRRAARRAPRPAAVSARTPEPACTPAT